MISKVFFMRIEPCFKAKKTRNGDASRVKKEGSSKDKKTTPKEVDKTPKTDTFTSSEKGKKSSPKTEQAKDKKYNS